MPRHDGDSVRDPIADDPTVPLYAAEFFKPTNGYQLKHRREELLAIKLEKATICELILSQYARLRQSKFLCLIYYYDRKKTDRKRQTSSFQ